MKKRALTIVVGLTAHRTAGFAGQLNDSGEYRCQPVIPEPGQPLTVPLRSVEVAFVFPPEEFPQVALWIEALRPHVRTLVLLDDLTASRSVLLSALAAGADGILAWPASLREVREAIVSTRRGGTPLPPELTTLLLDHLRDGRHINPAWHQLSPCEAQVMKLVAEGLANKLIADRLGITMGTVQNHLNHVYARLAVHSRTEALAVLFGPPAKAAREPEPPERRAPPRPRKR
jgi:DNA-binding NarL/FixJ family response regulator